ncbi:SsgA family sporulation/cell division regulator [Nocardiopsis aegyptia]|uniref:SsgA family sporulation/cell division regulator n=1 Tax=Nocardiopsis aegyptia TaxID=220378 RepID=UPI00366C3964
MVQNTPAQPITHHIVGMLIGPPDTLVTLALSYDAADPYTASLVFPATEGHPDGVVWDIDRGTLAQGLTRPAGDGDVRVAPHTRHGRNPRASRGIALDFFGPGQFARMVLNQTDLTRFLADTYEAVPSGTEPTRLDVDDTIARLLGAA